MTERKAVPSDYARWGADLGFQTAAQLRSKPNREARRYHIAQVRQIVAETCASYRRDGSSNDEIELYRDGFEQGLRGGQLGLPVKILTPDGEIEVKP